jgi:Sulfatase-modifying factor enzyme 1
VGVFARWPWWALALVACRAPTEIKLVLTTDVPCSQFQGAAIAVGDPAAVEAKAPTTTSTTCDTSGNLGSLVVVPSGSKTAEVGIRVIGGIGRDPESCAAPSYGTGCIVARREVNFEEAAPLTLPVALRASCNGVICTPDETCVDGSCRSSAVSDPAACEGAGCDETVLRPPGAGGCPAGPGPAMVAAGGFCIDATLVTRAAYATFLAARVSPSTEPAYCAFNTDFTPAGHWPPDPTTASLPVVNVDWCDAQAFCTWAGKRLCGKIGGGAQDQSAANDATTDQWFAACTMAGALTYPYGDTYEPTACDGADLGVGAPVPVASLPGCVGGYPGLFDMSGNVLEWEDACSAEAGTGDNCLKRSGDYGSGQGGLTCAAPDSAARGTNYDYAGFRCCSP